MGSRDRHDSRFGYGALDCCRRSTEVNLLGSPRTRIRTLRSDDDGSAIVEFVLVSVLVVVLILALVQLGVALYIRNSLVAAAAEGARYAAADNREPGRWCELHR